jgi:8-oxo-dGTP pyrophosphatase MutT (NUDIX family)
MKDRIRQSLLVYPKRKVEDKSYGFSAVLVPLYEKKGEYFVLFTKRTSKVKYHKAQLSFPGGAFNPQDGDLKSTALRETFEEIGIRPEDVDILGELDDVATLTSRYIITPFVGFIPYPYKFKVNSEEVEKILVVPLKVLGEGEGQCEYEGEIIWGATFIIVKSLLRALGESLDCTTGLKLV